MRIGGRVVVAVAAAALALSACVAEPGASPDPSASPGVSPAASAQASAEPVAATSPAPSPACPTPLPLDPATGAMVTTIDALVALGDAAAACYGDAKLQVTAYVPGAFEGGDVDVYDYQPAWLYASSIEWAAFLSGARGGEQVWLPVRIPPALGSCQGTQLSPDCVLHPYARRWISAIGHFDDPASATCTATPLPGFDPPPPPITPAESEAECRTRFVLDSFTELHATGAMPTVDPALCPVDPVTLDQLVEGATGIGPWYGASCLADREITFDAFVVPGVGLLSGMEQDTVEPRWLADPLNTGVVFSTSADAADDATSWFVARVPPDATPGAFDARCDGSAVDPESCPFSDVRRRVRHGHRALRRLREHVLPDRRPGEPGAVDDDRRGRPRLPRAVRHRHVHARERAGAHGDAADDERRRRALTGRRPPAPTRSRRRAGARRPTRRCPRGPRRRPPPRGSRRRACRGSATRAPRRCTG